MLDYNDKQYLDRTVFELKSAPDDISILIRVGRLYFEPFGDSRQAMQYFQKALSLDGRNTEARFWSAKCTYHDFCDIESAKRSIEEALAINPNLPECLSLLVSILGDLNAPLEKRIELERRAVELAPDWLIPRHGLAILLAEAGQYAEACAIVSP